MIKKEVKEVETYWCDFPGCEKEAYDWRACSCCNAMYCEDHLKIMIKELKSMMHFSTSGDDYCVKCILNPPDKFKSLLQMYDRMAALRKEEEDFYARIKPEYEELEKRIEKAKDELRGE